MRLRGLTSPVRVDGALTRGVRLAAAFAAAAAVSAALIAGLLSGVSPTGASVQVPVIITGTGFNGTAASNEVVFVHADGTTRTAPGEVVGALNATTGQRTLTLRVPDGLPPGRVTLTVRNTVSNETSAGTGLDVLAIALPTVASAAPGASGVQVRITGSSNVVFLAGKTTVSFPGGTGITVASTTVESPTSLVAVINVASTAPLGARNVQVKTSTQTSLLIGGFQVGTAPPANRNPTADAHGPYSGVAGTAIAFNGSGSDLDAGDVLSYAWAFGDGGTATGAAASHTYAAAGSYTATLTVTDGHGGSATSTAAVTVVAANRNPTADAHGPYSGVAGTAIAFNGSGSDPDSGDILSYGWAFGDGGTATGAAASHTYAAAGSYTATLTVTDGHGGSATSNAAVTVAAANRNPTADAHGPYSGVAGTAIDFSGTGSDPDSGDILSYAWTFGDGGTAIGAAASHTYATAGSYTATLTVTDGHGGSATSTAAVTVVAANRNPTADAHGPYSGVAGTAIAFNGSGSDPDSGDILSYAWTFGDGGTATGAAASHTYATAGSYTATLTVTDGHGGSATSTAAVTVAAANRNPTADVHGPYSGVAGTAIAFNGSGSDPDSGDILSYAWTFGDGGTATGAAASHTYAAAGSYTATLTVTDGHGGSATSNAAVTVAAANRNPTADAHGPYSGVAGTAIAFNGSGSDPDSGDILSYGWAFGDGGTATGAAASHTYAAAGSYTATLTVTDGHGGSATSNAAVTVAAANRNPTANPGGPYAGAVNAGIVFNGTGSADPDGDLLSFAWSFDDGTAASGPAPVHAFAQAGQHTVTLLVSDSRGGTSSASTLASVTAAAAAPGNHAPVASAGGPYNSTVQTAVTLHGEGSGDADNDPLTFAWSFGDGTTGSGASPLHTYTAPGRYTATLLVTDGRGGSDTATTVVVVGAAPQAANNPPTADAGGPYTAAAGSAITLLASASDPDGDTLNYAWSFGDGSSGDGPTPTHQYLNAGSYNVTLLVTDGRGGAVAAATTAIVTAVAGNQPPTAQPGGPYLGVAGQPLAFTFSGADPDQDSLTFAARFGDGSEGVGTSPSHTYAQAGTYLVTLVVSDGRGGVVSVTTAAVISADSASGNHPPTAKAGGPYFAILGQPVTLDGSGSTDPDAADTLTFAWTLGDGANAVGPQPSHLFAAEGTYPVVLLVSDGQGGTSTASTTVIVSPANVPQNQNPRASAGGPYSTTLGGSLVFSSAGSSDPDGDTLTYSWNFGDGTTGSGAAPSYTYTAAGDYIVSLLVTDGRGGSATASAEAHVTPPAAANRPPVANAGGPYSGAPGAEIAFSGAGSSDPDQDALAYAWNFGDNSQPGSGPAPTHAYTNSGAYTVTLTVTDARGATSTAMASAVVGAVADRGPPVVSLHAPSEALPGSRIVVTALATDDVAVSSVRFEVSGAAPSVTQTAPYQRTIDVPAVVAPGTTIQVRAIATDPSNNSAHADASIRITFVADTESPNVALRAPAAAAPGSTVLLSATATDNVGISQVTFLVNGEPVSTDTEAPYEASFVVPAGAAAGSSLSVVARARDFAGNQADSGAAVLVSDSSDTTPPTVSLTAAPKVTRGGTLALAATAADDGGVYSISFYVDGVRIAVGTVAPYAANYKLPLSVAGGTTLQLRAVARDFAGNEATATAATVIDNPSGAGRGVVTGEVYDDTTGLPLSNVTIALTGNDDDTQPYAATAVTDARGRYLLRAERGAGVLRIAKAGYTAVDRVIAITAGRAQEVVDARLTPLQPMVTISPLLGGSAGSDAARLVVSSGAIDGELQLSVTPLGQQGLQGLLPPGWVPVAAADVRPHGVTFPASVPLSMRSGFSLPTGSTLVLAVWDDDASAWRALSLATAGGAAAPLEEGVTKTGQFAWLLADVVPAAPPLPAAGDLLIGTAGALIPPQTTPRIDPQPKIAFYSPGISSAVRAYVDTTAAIPSGSVLWINVSENYRFLSGAETHPEPFVQDLVFFQQPGAPLSQAAGFPATPSQVFDALTLERGIISLEMLVPPAAPATPALPGPDGGTITGGDVALVIPAGALGDFTPVDVRPLQITDLGVSPPAGLQFIGGAQVGLSGRLGTPAALSLPAPAGGVDGVLLVRLQEIQGQTRFVLAGIGAVVDGRLVSASTVGGAGELDGIREAGRYLFFRPSALVGFAAGRVLGVGGAPFPSALVMSAGLPIVSLSGATGAYVAAAPAGAATLTALDLIKSDSGAASTTIVAAEVAPLDLRLVAQAPRVVAIVPAGGAQNVALGAPIVVTFSEPVDPGSVGSGGDVAVTPAGGTAVPGTFSLSNGNTVLTFRPAAPLEPNTRYTVTVGTSIRDLAGYAIEAAVSSVFDSLDTAPPPQPAAGAVTASLPSGGNTTVRGTQGTASPRDTVTVVNLTTGAITPVLIDPNGGFTTLVVAAPTDLLKVRIVDQAGNEISVGIPRFSQTNADGSVSTAVGSEGGRILGPGGIAADVAAGTFPAGAVVTLRAVSEAAFPVAIPAAQQQNFGFSGAFEIDFGGVVPTRYVNVSIPAAGGETPTDQWLVTQVVDVNGTPALNVVDTAKFINGRIAHLVAAVSRRDRRRRLRFPQDQFQSVGLNYGVMQQHRLRRRSSRNVQHARSYGFMAMPFLSYIPDIQIPMPVCYPVLTGRVTVVPNSVLVTVDGAQLTPADREIIVRNPTRGSENRFPRNVIELSLEMPGKDSDSYQVKAIGAAQEVVLSGISITPAQSGVVTDPARPRPHHDPGSDVPDPESLDRRLARLPAGPGATAAEGGWRPRRQLPGLRGRRQRRAACRHLRGRCIAVWSGQPSASRADRDDRPDPPRDGRGRRHGPGTDPGAADQRQRSVGGHPGRQDRDRRNSVFFDGSPSDTFHLSVSTTPAPPSRFAFRTSR